jgi:hypothetical protein
MTKCKFVGAAILVLLLGCTEEKNREIHIYDIKSDLSDSTIVYPQLYEIEELFAPAQFSLQSNKEGLVVTPRVPASGYSLFYYMHQDPNTCCPQMNGLTKTGRGPGESGAMISGTRTADSDTLVYYSMDTSRFYHYDQNLNLIKDPLISVIDILVTDRFAYTNCKYYSEATFSDEEKILRIYDSTTKTTKTLIDNRIPHGYQPAARNNIASIISTPEHILIALVGEKEIMIFDGNDLLTGKIVLGENDPLPEPYIPISSEDIKSSSQHIFKMEYYDGMIFVLMKTGLFVFNNDYEFVIRFVFNDRNEENLDISDFTVNSDMLYLRQGLSSLYRIDYFQIKSILLQD